MNYGLPRSIPVLSQLPSAQEQDPPYQAIIQLKELDVDRSRYDAYKESLLSPKLPGRPHPRRFKK